METVKVVTHPLVQHKLSIMRKKETSTNKFRTLLTELSCLLAYEVTADFPLAYETIETPLTTMQAPFIDGKKVVLVSILRAGNGLLEGMLQLIPSARVGHIGLFRDHVTLEPVEYYIKLPEDLHQRHVIVVDPMLATANSAIYAISKIKKLQPLSVKFVCILAAPEGVDALRAAHPDVPIFTAAIDEKLNDKGYILPGLGDAGDRIYGTK
jgi:uracil phosphoribosyltransferase